MSITLLRLPNSAGIKSTKLFLLKFLSNQISGVSYNQKVSRKQTTKNSYSQFQEMFQISKRRRNGTGKPVV